VQVVEAESDRGADGELSFMLRRDDDDAPGVVAAGDAPAPVVLLGHGGSGHKRTERHARLATWLLNRLASRRQPSTASFTPPGCSRRRAVSLPGSNDGAYRGRDRVMPVGGSERTARTRSPSPSPSRWEGPPRL